MSTILQPANKWTSSSIVFLILPIILLSSALAYWLDFSNVTVRASLPLGMFSGTSKVPKNPHFNKIDFPLPCSNNESTPQKCNVDYPTTFEVEEKLSAESCPEYFRWIHEDLRPWKSAGISRNTLESAKQYAHFRLVIVNGKAYVEKYGNAFQTRDVFTIWGIVQLLRLYPGKVPNLELMFRCGDRTVIRKRQFGVTSPPALFQYSSHRSTLNFVFPDWTFWGWAELNIRPWKGLLEDIREGNNRTEWKDRVPYAFWQGNPRVAPTRGDLMKCNVTQKQDWNARLYTQNWIKEIREGFNHSKLADQCTHRYKIYIEGAAWSVSEKYILACDSMTLMIKPEYYDFFTRSLVPMRHYWHINPSNKCRSIKFAVEWGNNNTDKAQAIGKAGSRFIQEALAMEHVYDYMFHLLSGYAKLLKFEPKIPEKAEEVCAEAMACSWKGLWRKFMEESMVKSPSDRLPCTMPPPYQDSALHDLVKRKENVSRQIEMWEAEYWKHHNRKQ